LTNRKVVVSLYHTKAKAMKAQEMKMGYAQAEQRRIADMFGVKPGAVSKSVTPWGVSLYVKYGGYKVRFSDHQTSNFSGRHIDEVHVPLGSEMEVVEDRIRRKDPANYSDEIVTIEAQGISADSVSKYYINAVSIVKGDFIKTSKKGNDVFKFTVTLKNKVFNA